MCCENAPRCSMLGPLARRAPDSGRNESASILGMRSRFALPQIGPGGVSCPCSPRSTHDYKETGNEEMLGSDVVFVAVRLSGVYAGALYGRPGVARNPGESEAGTDGHVSNQLASIKQTLAGRAEASGPHRGLQGFPERNTIQY